MVGEYSLQFKMKRKNVQEGSIANGVDGMEPGWTVFGVE